MNTLLDPCYVNAELNAMTDIVILHNYFDDLTTKLFLDLYLAKFLDTSGKPSFPCGLIYFS